MKTVFTIFSYLFFLITNAQNPHFEWQKFIGDIYHDYGKDIYETPDNGYLVFGSLYSPGTLSDYCIIKLDAERNIESQYTFGGSDYDEGEDLILTSDGGYLIGGSSRSNDGNVGANYGGSDLWLAKVDSQGNLLWEKNYGGTDDEFLKKIIDVPDDGFLIIAYSGSNDGDVSNNYGDGDYWIVKISETGNIEWEKNFGGSEYEVPVSGILTQNNDVIIVGYSLSQNGDITAPHGNFDYWVIKVDDTGELIWEKSLGGSGNDRPMGIIKDNGTEEAYLVFGNSNSSNGNVSNPLGLNDGWVVKVDIEGNVIWDKSFGDERTDYIFDFKLSNNSGYIYSGGYHPPDSFERSIIRETDYEGNEIWNLSFGLNGWWGIEYYMHELKYSNNGNLLTIGHWADDTTSQIWFAKIGLEDMGIHSESNPLIRIYPNPVKNYMNIESNEVIESVVIYDLSGQKIYSSLGNDKCSGELNLSNLVPGSYIAKIKTYKSEQTIKFLKL